MELLGREHDPRLRAELYALQGRLIELQTSLTNFHVQPDLSWLDLLEKFNVLSGQFYKANDAVRSSFEDIVVHPRVLPVEDMQQRPELLTIVPQVFFRTKPSPSVEQLHASLIPNNEFIEDKDEAATELERLKALVATYDASCKNMEAFAEQKKTELQESTDTEAPIVSQTEILLRPTKSINQQPSLVEQVLMSWSQGVDVGSVVNADKSLLAALSSSSDTSSSDFVDILPLGGTKRHAANDDVSSSKRIVR